ncbi:selenocysteine-tRNA-specific elongation factor [Trypanosoma cruzi]|nr:selenocysteine-tRNA-specific elongation factor [Trypanosoma cruzi]
MAGGAPSRTAQRTPARERRQVIPPDVSGQFWVTTLLSLDAFALQHFSPWTIIPLQEKRDECSAPSTSPLGPRIWDEGVSGVVADLRCAHKYWQHADQTKLAFECLVAWISALEAERDSTDQFMNFGRILLQEFRMRLMMTSDPGIPLSKPRALPYTAVHEADTFARASQPLAERRGTQISLRCQLCHVHGTVISKSNVRPRGSYSQRGRPSESGKGADDGSSIQSATSHQSAQAAHRAADAPPDLSNCPTKSSRRAMELIRKRRSTVVRRITDIPALGQLYEESKRGRSRDVCAVNVGAENVPSRAIHNLLLHARTADERGELRGLFDGNRRRRAP